jgi:hypothetical protein
VCCSVELHLDGGPLLRGLTGKEADHVQVSHGGARPDWVWTRRASLLGDRFSPHRQPHGPVMSHVHSCTIFMPYGSLRSCLSYPVGAVSSGVA